VNNSKKPNKHDRYVLELYKKVQDRYDYLILDYNISSKKRMLGQIDLCGVKGTMFFYCGSSGQIEEVTCER
jgi:hypothetical protein